MKQSPGLLFYTLVFLLVLPSLAFSQDFPSDIGNQVDEVFAAWNSEKTPGGVVGITQNGQLIFSRAYGLASLEYDVPNTTETIFNIASVSKQITAYSMVLLAQQGKLALDDEIQKHLPEVPDFGHRITIRHLLHHTSGLRNFQNILAMAGWRTGESMTNEDLLRFLSKQKELNFKPGDEYLYCNTGFNICTTIVERLTGQTFQDWTRDNIFVPLGMEHTSYREDMEKVHKNTANCYNGNAVQGFSQPLKYWTYMGNGNVYTTLADLAKWLENFQSKKLGGAEGIAEMVKPGVLNNGEALTYGLGIGVGEYRGLKRYSHGGSVGGYRSNMVYFPEQQLGIIVLSNFSSANPGGKVRALTDMLLADHLAEAAATESAPPDISREKVTLDLAQVDPFLGKYYVEGVTVEFGRQKDQLFVFAEGQMPMPVSVVPSSENTFFSENVNLAMRIIEPDEEPAPHRIYVEFNGARHRGFQLWDAEKSQDLAGTYYSPELDTRYEIVLEAGSYRVLHQRHEAFELMPVGEDELVGTAYFFRDVQVERENGTVKGIRVSNGRVRNLWFEKK